MTYPYREALKPEEVLVVLRDEEHDSSRRRLVENLMSSAQRFGFSVVVEDGHQQLVEVGRDYKVRHLIWRIPAAPTQEAVDAAGTIVQGGWSCSLTFAYDSRPHMLAAEPLIAEWKRVYGDRLNFLRPDVFEYERATVSIQKITDNAVCDTVRIKYIPRCLDSSIPAALGTMRSRAFFDRSSRLYERFRLHHRSHFDGYFAMRVDDGFLITATKTSKIGLDLARITHVHQYDQTTNVLTFTGAFLPSSDSVEAGIVFDENRDIQMLVHTHASERFTRNPAFLARCLVPELPYGEVALGRALSQALRSIEDGFVIMKEHGEVFASVSLDPATLLDAISNLCRSHDSANVQRVPAPIANQARSEREDSPNLAAHNHRL